MEIAAFSPDGSVGVHHDKYDYALFVFGTEIREEPNHTTDAAVRAAC